MLATPPWQRAADPSRRIGHSVEVHAELRSTSDRARAVLDEPNGEGRAILAELQTAGRGRLGRVWSSPAGVNLMVSVAFRPVLAPDMAWRLGFAAALAVCDACEPWAPLSIKWPNDLYTADGLKVGGILVETAIEDGSLGHAVVGIGLNVNWRRSKMPGELAATATSLAELSGAPVDRVAVLGALLAALDREVASVERGVSPVPRVSQRSWLDGRRVAVEAARGPLVGDVEGIADDGALLVRTTDGIERVTFGDVVHVATEREVAA